MSTAEPGASTPFDSPAHADSLSAGSMPLPRHLMCCGGGGAVSSDAIVQRKTPELGLRRFFLRWPTQAKDGLEWGTLRVLRFLVLSA
jgi:hypothetical protein